MDIKGIWGFRFGDKGMGICILWEARNITGMKEMSSKEIRGRNEISRLQSTEGKCVTMH